MRVLLIEDNQALAELLVPRLANFGFAADWLTTIGPADAAIRNAVYRVIILDRRLPDGDGLGLVRAMRSRRDATPVLVLTAQGAASDRIEGLNAGADDYLVKPVDTEELAARLQALVRRSGEPSTEVLSVGQLVYTPQDGLVTVAGRPATFPPHELQVLEVLLRRQGRVVSRRQLAERLFGRDIDSGFNVLDALVNRLGRRLDDTGAEAKVHTVPGVGFLLRARPP